jgi:hypothetical protein
MYSRKKLIENGTDEEYLHAADLENELTSSDGMQIYSRC